MSRTLLAQVLVKAVKRSPLGRGKARKFTLGMIKKIHPQPIQSNFRKVPFLFHLDNTTERKALISDAYDKAELNFLMGFLNKKPTAFIDIGANSGLYSAFLAAQMPVGSRVIAVEPNPSMCRRIALNTALLRRKGLTKGVTIEIAPVALGAAAAELYLDLGSGLGPAHLTGEKSENSFAVPVKTLLDLCREKEIGEIGAAKIDVEGYEDRILLPFLAGADARLLPRALVFETVHSDAWESDAIEACVHAGYRVAGKTRSSILLTHRAELAPLS